jgi:hypothetical protein
LKLDILSKPMDDGAKLGRIREDLRAVSKEVFGKQYRLEIAAAISALEPPIWSRQIAQILGLAENQVASEVSSYARIGALQRFPIEHDRRKIYQPVPHPFWIFSRQLLEETIGRNASGAADEAINRYWASILDEAAPRSAPQ